MNKPMWLKVFMVAGVLVVLPAFHVDAGGEPPTGKEIDAVWTGDYAHPGRKWDAVCQLIDRIGSFQKEQHQSSIGTIEEAIFAKLLSMPIGTVADFQDGRENTCEVDGVDKYLTAMLRWDLAKADTNLLLCIAGCLGRYQPLPDLSHPDAMRLAHQVDNIILYGTNEPPFRAGTTRLWGGPIGERVFKTRNFRSLYNHKVIRMRRHILRHGHALIFTQGFANMPCELREALWLDFATRAKASPDERRKAEG